MDKELALMDVEANLASVENGNDVNGKVIFTVAENCNNLLGDAVKVVHKELQDFLHSIPADERKNLCVGYEVSFNVVPSNLKITLANKH